jgi:hypothetical protein
MHIVEEHSASFRLAHQGEEQRHSHRDVMTIVDKKTKRDKEPDISSMEIKSRRRKKIEI